MFTVLAAIAIVYWPARHGGFVWDDQLCFHDAAWLRDANWTRYLFRGFCDWTDYFRPLAVAVYALQVRTFDGEPGSMHLVSLGLHLLNTLLVGTLALRLRARAPAWPGVAVMLVYGLHPALIEPVFWIGCQYEMLVVLFILLGLIANSAIERATPRAFAVAGAFFLAACSKESAAAFPFVLFVFDLATTSGTGTLRGDMLATWRRQRLVYLCILAAGLAYLAVRHWAIGATATPLGAEPLLSLARAQKAALAYTSYWKLIVWPMTGLGPIHPIAAGSFSGLTAQSLAIDAVAAAILACGIIAFARGLAVGTLVLAASAALLPVLHLVPIAFNESLYHERYAMLALAVACAWLPSALAPLQAGLRTIRPLYMLAVFAAVGWIALAVLNIQVTLPLWSDELALWQWAVREHPDSLDAKQHLLAKYVERNDRPHARALAQTLVAENAPCPVCMLEIALFGAGDGDVELTAAAIERIRNGKTIPGDPLFLQEFVMAQGELLELQHDPTSAAAAYNDAIELDPLDARPRMNLAYLHLRLGEVAQARAIAEIALPLYAPDERRRRRAAFEEAVEALSRQPTPPEYPVAEPGRR